MAKKKIEKIEEVKEPKVGITNDEFLQHTPVTFTTQRCGDCGGGGLTSANTFCARCVGTGQTRI